MKYLILSDIHLDYNFDQNKHDFLEKLFSKYDKIILNGDFWDGFVWSFDEFIESKWNTLFPILKRKHTIYIPGNHDFLKWSDQRIYQFCDKVTDNFQLEIGKEIYNISHGHKYHVTPEIYLYINKLPRYFRRKLFYLKGADKHYIKKAHELSKKITTIPKGTTLNLKIKQLATSDYPLDQWYLFGHTHDPELNYKSKFANSGFCQYGFASYLSIDQENGIELHTEIY